MRRAVEYIFDSHKGVHRSANKDRVFSWFENSKFGSYFAVFDGVSSSAGATRAINLAARSIKRELISQFKNNVYEPTKLICTANDVLVNSSVDNPYTTITFLAIPADVNLKCLVCNVGDTRLYSVARQYVEKITVDHSNPVRNNILTQCLGLPDIKPEERIIAENYRDELRLLVCTDGFYRHIKDDWLHVFSSCFKKNMQSVRRELSSLVRDNDDDATYLLVRVNYVRD